MIRKVCLLIMILMLVGACAPAPAATTPTDAAPEADATEEAEAADADATEEAEADATEEVDAAPTVESPSAGVSDDSAAPRTLEELQAYTGWTCPEELRGGSLSIYNWSTYIAEDTISNFETLCDATVTYDVFDGNDALLARMRQGNPGYDIIVPSDFAVATMITEDLLLPLTRENIPNFANLSENLLDAPYDPGNMYSLPYQWGTIGIGYNVEAVGETVTSWRQLFEYEGNVAWLEDSRGMMGIALRLLGFDPNTTNPDEISAARDFLSANGSNVQALAVDDGQALLERGEADMVIEYNGDIFQVIADCECDTYAYVVPEEGTNLWVDNVAIPVDAPNQRMAEAFIDYILAPQVAADISNYTAYASPNQAAIDQELITADLLTNTGIYPTDDITANLFFIQALPSADAALYNDAWDQVKIAIGG